MLASNFSWQLLKTIGKVDGPVTSSTEIGTFLLDREAWRSRISMIVKENTSSDSRRCTTKSDTVV
jgi:hypothetical protein